MRLLEAGLAAHVAGAATTLAACWRIVRDDGVMLGFTDHDEALGFDGTEFRPAHGLDGGERGGQTRGAASTPPRWWACCTSEAIAEVDILLGRFDGASVETWRVNWRDTAQRLLVRPDDDRRDRARGRGVPGRTALRAAGAQPAAGAGVSRRSCDAELGDARVWRGGPRRIRTLSGRGDGARRCGTGSGWSTGVAGFDVEAGSRSGVAGVGMGKRDGLRDRGGDA